MAPVPEMGLPEHTCPDWEPEPEPESEPEPYGRMLFAPDGHAELGRVEDRHTVCADTPDELLAPVAETLGLPAATCAELLLEGGASSVRSRTREACKTGRQAWGRHEVHRLMDLWPACERWRAEQERCTGLLASPATCARSPTTLKRSASRGRLGPAGCAWVQHVGWWTIELLFGFTRDLSNLLCSIFQSAPLCTISLSNLKNLRPV